MAENKSVCSLLFISHDLEWIHAFQKGVQRFYLTNEKTVSTLDEVETLLSDYQPSLIILGVDKTLPTMDKLKQLLHSLDCSIPVMVVNPQALESTDAFIKLGADYVVARRDLLTSIRIVQYVMRQVESLYEVAAVNRKSQSVQELYERLFIDIPDPICYLQDGLFLEINPAFLKKFKIKDRKSVEEFTFMNFVTLKSERNVKQLMKLALEKDVVPAETIELHDVEGEKIEMVAQVSRVIFNGEKAVQMYLRDNSAGGGSSSTDPTTGLATPITLKASIRQTQERSSEKLLGVWVYLWLENYREVFQKDGYAPAEILIRSVVDTAERFLPPSTEMVRYADDSILMWITGDKEQAIVRVQNLVTHLDELVPENIGRMVHPHTFAGMLEVRNDSTFEELLSKSYRAVKALSMSQSKERIAEPAAADMTRKDERRVNEITKMIEANRINFLYQPISALEPDGVERYADVINILPDLDAVEGVSEEIETDSLLQLADRYGLGRRIDRVKISQFCQDILSYNGDQHAIQGYLSITNDALNDEEFSEWVANQLKQTGISPKQIIFELKLDSVANAYSGTMRLIDKMRPLGTRFAVTEVGRLDDEVKEIFARVKPDIIKLDIREVDTFEDDEEVRFMTAIKEYADENNVMIIAEHMESPAQLSRVWPYDIQYLQGNGLITAGKGFEFDFSEPLF